MSSLADLQALILEKYGIEAAALDPSTSIKELGMDSLALAEFLFEIEDKLKVSLPDNDLTIDTLAGLAVLVDQARAKQAA